MAHIIDFETYLLEEVDGKEFDIPALLVMEDEAGVGVAVVMPAPISVRTGEVYFHPDNAGVARVIKTNPRFIVCVSVNPTFAEEAVSEMEKFVRGEGFKGVKLNSELHDYNIDDRITDPVMEKARELGLVASIHSATGNCHPNRIGRLAASFPDVPIIMDHMGYPDATEDAIRVAEECPNVVLGTTIPLCGSSRTTRRRRIRRLSPGRWSGWDRNESCLAVMPRSSCTVRFGPGRRSSA